ncbi:MAG: DUF1615 family protein [Thermodesulfobacteriota bacterium]
MQREAELRRLDRAVSGETAKMRAVVRVIDRDRASWWLASFVSSKPFQCPPARRSEWTDAIIGAVERNELPVCKELLGLVACLVAIESGFHADPLAVDPAGGQDMSKLLQRAEEELRAKYGAFLSIPPIPAMSERYKQEYVPLLLACRTEGEIEKVADRIAQEVRKDMASVPDVVKRVADKGLARLTSVVRTKGSMQLNFNRARQVMTERGEQFTDQELSDYMYTTAGGVDVGVAALKSTFVQYAAECGNSGDLAWLFFVGMDYHYGPFTSRNVVEQLRICDLSGRNLQLDGDLLHYGEEGKPSEKPSETLNAALAALPGFGRTTVMDAFLLEKDPHYRYTDLHRELAKAHAKSFGKTPFALLGDLRMGHDAQIKHGVLWKTRAYLKKLDRYLNSVPWDR